MAVSRGEGRVRHPVSRTYRSGRGRELGQAPRLFQREPPKMIRPARTGDRTREAPMHPMSTRLVSGSVLAVLLCAAPAGIAAEERRGAAVLVLRSDGLEAPGSSSRSSPRRSFSVEAERTLRSLAPRSTPFISSGGPKGNGDDCRFPGRGFGRGGAGVSPAVLIRSTGTPPLSPGPWRADWALSSAYG
ncbi:MAG: hypothetical protein MZV70_70420 [Desulfobacterales bacterium]|nr:hypothetical protein [Desulfobacterales bacterium]